MYVLHSPTKFNETSHTFDSNFCLKFIKGLNYVLEYGIHLACARFFGWIKIYHFGSNELDHRCYRSSCTPLRKLRCTRYNGIRVQSNYTWHSGLVSKQCVTGTFLCFINSEFSDLASKVAGREKNYILKDIINHLNSKRWYILKKHDISEGGGGKVSRIILMLFYIVSSILQYETKTNKSTIAALNLRPNRCFHSTTLTTARYLDELFHPKKDLLG